MKLAIIFILTAFSAVLLSGQDSFSKIYRHGGEWLLEAEGGAGVQMWDNEFGFYTSPKFRTGIFATHENGFSVGTGFEGWQFSALPGGPQDEVKFLVVDYGLWLGYTWFSQGTRLTIGPGWGYFKYGNSPSRRATKGKEEYNLLNAFYDEGVMYIRGVVRGSLLLMPGTSVGVNLNIGSTFYDLDWLVKTGKKEGSMIVSGSLFVSVKL
jgi:hypothetical protein